MSAIAGLRAATWTSHQRLEKRLDIKARFASPAAYRGHLVQMWGFCAGLEQKVAPDAFGDALTDYPRRRKLPLLTRDLAALGCDALSLESLPRCESLPACPDTATAFGCVYVLEGATLGGRTLLPLVQKSMGLTAESGAAFLSSYGEAVTDMWRSFGAALDTWCATPVRRDLAAAAAVATFDALDHWLCGSPR
jgi:heme oxygenase